LLFVRVDLQGNHGLPLCSTEEEANTKVAEYGKGYEIEIRQGERTRCERYCQVNKFCTQYQQYLSTKE